MENRKNIEQRVVELETHLAHQEITIQDLSDGVAKQWEVIDNLLSSVRLFKDKIVNLEEEAQANYVENPPPHY
jgi:SlyX protein